jgi:hypothetical protein
MNWIAVDLYKRDLIPIVSYIIQISTRTEPNTLTRNISMSKKIIGKKKKGCLVLAIGHIIKAFLK